MFVRLLFCSVFGKFVVLIVFDESIHVFNFYFYVPFFYNSVFWGGFKTWFFQKPGFYGIFRASEIGEKCLHSAQIFNYFPGLVSFCAAGEFFDPK